MRNFAKYILFFLLFSGVLFSVSDSVQKTDNNTDEVVQISSSNVACPGMIDCNLMDKQDVTNPDYVPPKCGECYNGRGLYKFNEIANDRECYFGRKIGKKN